MDKENTALYDLLIESCRHTPDAQQLESYAARIDDWAGFLDSAYAHGVFPLVHKSLKSITAVPENIKLRLKSTNLEIARRNMTMTAELLKIMKLLEENSIPALAIKGPVLSQMIHGDVTQRQFSDLDILLDQDNLYRAVELLCANGFISEQPIKFLKNKMLLKVAQDFVITNENKNIHIEMHWRLFRGRLFKKADMQIFRDSPYACMIQGKSIYTLDKEVQILYLLLHGSKHMWERIEWVADIDRLVRSDETINWDQIFRWAEIMEIAPMIFLGIAVCDQLFQTPFSEQVIHRAKQYPNIQKASDILIKKIYNDDIHSVNDYMSHFYYLGLEDSKRSLNKILSRFYLPTARDIYHINLPYILSPLYYMIVLAKVSYIQSELMIKKIFRVNDEKI